MDGAAGVDDLSHRAAAGGCADHRRSKKARGPIAKTELLQNRLTRLSAREGEYVVKILTGDLRIGLREGLVEEAIASAFDAPLDDVKEANMLLGDIGQTALLAARGELQTAELSLFRPIKCMLASPEPTAEAIWERFAEGAESSDLRRGQVRRHPRAIASRKRSRGNFFARSAADDCAISRARGTRARIRRRK